MGLYMSREETPEAAFRAQLELQQSRATDPEYEEPGAEPEAAEPPDPLAELTPEQRAAVDQQLAHQYQSIRANLARQGMDLTPNLQPALVDPQRAQAWLGPQQYAPQPQAQAPQPQMQQAQAGPDPEDDQPIPDAQYNPAEYKRWLRDQVTAAVKGAIPEAIAPLVQTVRSTQARTVEREINGAVAQVGDAILQYAPWLETVLDHPEFEAMFRNALTQVEPDKWGRPQDLAAVAGMVAPYLPPLPPGEGYAPPPGRGPAYNMGYAQQTRQVGQRQNPQGYAQPAQGYYPQGYGQQVPPPIQPPPPRNQQGRFVGRAAVGQAAAEATAPSRSAGRPPVQQQYDEALVQAAARMNIPVEEAKLLMQDSTGDAAEQLRSQRLKALR